MIPLPAAPNSYHVIAWESFGLCCSLNWGTLCHCGMALQVWPPHLKACFRGIFACLRVWDVSAKCCSGGVCIYIWMCVTDVVRSHRSGVGWGVTAERTHLLQLARRSWGRRREREMLRSLTMCAGRGWLHTTAGVKDWTSLAEIIKSS